MALRRVLVFEEKKIINMNQCGKNTKKNNLSRKY